MGIEIELITSISSSSQRILNSVFIDRILLFQGKGEEIVLDHLFLPVSS
jgi:hypothetical protein